MPVVEVEEEEEMNHDQQRSRGRGGGGKDKIDTLGRLLTKILRRMATELNLSMQSDGVYIAPKPKNAVRKDNKQRFNLLEENEEVLLRANQGHTVSRNKAPFEFVIQGTFAFKIHVWTFGSPAEAAFRAPNSYISKSSKLELLDSSSNFKQPLKLYISDNKVILTEGFDGVVPVKCFEKTESWPDRKLISF